MVRVWPLVFIISCTVAVAARTAAVAGAAAAATRLNSASEAAPAGPGCSSSCGATAGFSS